MGLDRALERDFFMAAIAEGLSLRMATATQGDHRAATQAERLAVLVHDLTFAFDAQGTVICNGNFHGCH